MYGTSKDLVCKIEKIKCNNIINRLYIETYPYETSRDLACNHEETKSNNIMKQ